jgi:hypothetical protein
MFPSTWQYLSSNERRRCELEWHICTRLDVCMAQALATLTTAVASKLQMIVVERHHEAVPNHRPLEPLLASGFCFHIESLLSTHGHEIGMLEDLMVTMEALRHARILIVHEDGAVHDGLAVIAAAELYSNMEDAMLGQRTHVHARSNQEVDLNIESKVKESHVYISIHHWIR